MKAESLGLHPKQFAVFALEKEVFSGWLAISHYTFLACGVGMWPRRLARMGGQHTIPKRNRVLAILNSIKQHYSQQPGYRSNSSAPDQSAIKKNKILPSAATWMDLKNIMLSEIRQTNYCMISLK